MPRHPRVHPTFLILAALLDGQAHGYRIRQRIAELSEQRVVLEPGTLYRQLASLLDDGLVEESPDRPVAGDDERRRYYRLTRRGRKALTDEARHLGRVVRSVLSAAGASSRR